MQQSIGNNRISLIVNNHIQQFEIKAPNLQFSKGNLKPPIYRGNAHYGVQPHKKNQSLSIQHGGAQYMMNHLKIIPTNNNNKKTKLFSINSNTNNNNISIANSLSNQGHSNQVSSFHRPQSPVVLNISSDRHYLYQQQQQYSFQSKNNLSNNNPVVNSHNQVISQIGANIGQLPFQRDRVLNFRRNSIKLKGKLDNSINSKQHGSISILQSINTQKNNTSYLNDSPIAKSQNNGVCSSNDQISDLEKVNNSSSIPNTNNGTIMNINTSSLSNKNLSNSSSTNNQNNSSSTNKNNNTNNINKSNTNNNITNNNNKNNNSIQSNNYNINNINNNNNFNSNINYSIEQNTNNQIYNINSSLNCEKKYRISKTQILFPFSSRENQTITNNQNSVRSSSKNISNSKIINNPKILNNQSFQEDEILYNKAASQPADILREQMALGTPPQLAAYTTSATTDTLNRQTFRIRPYNMSSRQSSRGALKSTITSNGPTSSANQDNNIVNENQIFQNKGSNVMTSNNDLTDLSQNNINQNKYPQSIQRIFSSRSSRKLSQIAKSKLIRQPSSNINHDDTNSHQYHPHSNIQHPQLNGYQNQQNGQNQGIQKEIIVRKNSYWYNQREQQERKKKKEKSILTSNNDVSVEGQNQNTDQISIDGNDEENKNQHLLFRFPLKDNKISNQGKDIEKIEQINQKRENSPKGLNQKLSKRQSIARINQKQQQIPNPQPESEVQAFQFVFNDTSESNLNQPSLFSISNNILNIKTLSIKKVSSIENSKNLDDMTLSSTNPYYDVELRELLGEGKNSIIIEY